jgi:hypothetical protein
MTFETFSQEEKTTIGTSRSFGLIMATALGAATALNAWHRGNLWPWMGIATASILFAAFFRPRLLDPLNLVWFRLGLLLHKVTNPIVMAVIFYGTVFPTGIVMRALKKDILRLKQQPDAASYWILRTPPGPPSKAMKDQF